MSGQPRMTWRMIVTIHRKSGLEQTHQKEMWFCVCCRSIWDLSGLCLLDNAHSRKVKDSEQGGHRLAGHGNAPSRTPGQSWEPGLQVCVWGG